MILYYRSIGTISIVLVACVYTWWLITTKAPPIISFPLFHCGVWLILRPSTIVRQWILIRIVFEDFEGGILLTGCPSACVSGRHVFWCRPKLMKHACYMVFNFPIIMDFSWKNSWPVFFCPSYLPFWRVMPLWKNLKSNFLCGIRALCKSGHILGASKCLGDIQCFTNNGSVYSRTLKKWCHGLYFPSGL